MITGRTIAAFLLAGALLAPARAFGQAPEATVAEALFRAGRQAMDAKDFAQACPKFAESYRLDPGVGTLFNLANCEEKIGRVADAATHFRSVLEQLAPKDDRAPIARARLAAIEPRLAYLTLVLEPGQPAGTVVTRDALSLGAAALGVSIAVNPGEHEVVVSAPGREEERADFTINEGERRELALHAGPARAPSKGLAGPAVTPPPIVAQESGSSQRTIGFVLGGVGLASLGAGAITGVLTLGKASTVKDAAHCDTRLHCDPIGVDAAQSGKTLSVVSTATVIAGAAALATGVVLVLTSRPSAPVRAGLSMSPSGAGLQIGGAF